MNSKRWILAPAVYACLSVLLPAVPDPDLSGVWVMDKDRSFSNPAGLEQTMTLAHAGNTLKLDARLKTAQGEQLVQETWTLDGKDREVIPDGTAPGTKSMRRAYWLLGRRAIVLEEDRTSPSPNGSVTQKTTRKFTLSVDGDTLTVDYYFDNARGSYESKRVFLRR